jgi:methionine sulfoxide reductase heme-binding subunit
MHQVLIFFFMLHDLASALLARHLVGIKRFLLIVAHLSLFGFLFPDLRKDFGEMALNLLLVILFLSPASKIFRMRLLLQLMGLRRELGIMMTYLATVHGVGYLLDPQWFALLIAPYLKVSLFAIDPALLFGGTAYLLTLPLLLTSNSLAQRSLGKNWKRLHRVVYVLLVVVLIHRFLIKVGGVGEAVQSALLLGGYILAKLLAWKNFIMPLQKTLDWVALRYQEYVVARQSVPPVV